jgi:hypothetical protein
MLKSKKFMAVLVVLAMLVATMVPGFAGIDYGTGTTTTTPSSPNVYDVIPNVGTVSQAVYTLTVTPSAVNINDTISPIIKVTKSDGTAVTGDDLTNFLNNNHVTVTAGTYALQYDSNGDHFINNQDNYVSTITVSELTYANPNGQGGTDNIKLAPNSDKTAIVVVNSSNATVPFLVANYGKIYVTADNADQANIYLGGLTPTITYLGGDTKALETFPETAVIKLPYASYTVDSDAYAVLYENGNFLANISLTNLVDVNNDGLYDGYKVVLPPLSSTNKYTLTVKGLVNNPGNNNPYYAIGSINLDVQAASSTIVAPTDNCLAAGINDTVTFTMNDKEAAANGSWADNKPYVDLTKNIRFKVMKADGTEDNTGNYSITAVSGTGTVNVPVDMWLRLNSDGTLKNTVTGTTYGSAFDVTSGKVTVSANLPKGDTLVIDGAYTDYNKNNGIPTSPTNRQYVFNIAKLVAKAGTLTADPDSINANEYKNVTFTVKDVHGNPIPNAEIKFSSPVVYVGGTGSTSNNVTTTVTTKADGTVTATLFSAFPTTITASTDLADKSKDITVNPSQQTGANVVFTIGSNNYTVGGATKTMDTAAYETNGRTLVPARYLAEALNAESYYDEDTQVVTFIKGDTTIQFTLGSKQMSVIRNGVKVTTTMETAATSLDASGNDVGRTFVPARYVAEPFGYKVDYDATANTVTIH